MLFQTKYYLVIPSCSQFVFDLLKIPVAPQQDSLSAKSSENKPEAGGFVFNRFFRS